MDVAANPADRFVTDEVFIRHVCRYSPSSLLPLIAYVASRYWEVGSWLKSPLVKFTPWTLAEIARVSLVFGDGSVTAATMRDLLECADDYTSLADPDLDTAAANAVTSFLLRVTAEQLPFQQFSRHEMSRSAALFDQTSASSPLKVMNPGWDVELLGCSVSQYVGTGFLVHSLAVNNDGRFSIDWCQQESMLPITNKIPVAVIRNVLAQHFVGDLSFFRNHPGQGTSSPYRRFGYNPLLGRPVVDGIRKDLLVPVPGQLIRKISPLGLYYSGVEKWGDSFAEDCGALFEQYVGRQLHILPNAQVYPEIVYDRDNKRSVDWIVVCANAILLVEVKSVRPTEKVRLGSDEALAEHTRMLGKAYKQIANTDALIAAGHTPFAHIPSSLPRLGLVVTMEPFPVANANDIRTQHGVSATLPIGVCACEEVERLVCMPGGDLDTFLTNQLSDPERSEWQISTGLSGIQVSRNPVLDQAWDSYDWGTEAG